MGLGPHERDHDLDPFHIVRVALFDPFPQNSGAVEIPFDSRMMEENGQEWRVGFLIGVLKHLLKVADRLVVVDAEEKRCFSHFGLFRLGLVHIAVADGYGISFFLKEIGQGLGDGDRPVPASRASDGEGKVGFAFLKILGQAFGHQREKLPHEIPADLSVQHKIAHFL
jgi:hypothetical protein